MIDISEKHNRRLASELQNSHVCEKCDPNLAVDKIRNMEHLGTFRNIPEHEKIKIIFVKINNNVK